MRTAGLRRITRNASKALHFLPKRDLSRAIGRAAQAEPPQALVNAAVAAFVRSQRIDMSEYQIPAGGYRSFDAFFTRALVAGARPIAQGARVSVAPADGRVEDVGNIDANGTLLIKGRNYTVAELLGSTKGAESFAGGRFCVIYLAPRNYHRVHAPVSGPVTKVSYLPGTFYPVNRWGVHEVPELLASNERVVVEQDSPNFGHTATVMVAALGVGHMTLSFDDILDRAYAARRDRTPETRVYGKNDVFFGKRPRTGHLSLREYCHRVLCTERQDNKSGHRRVLSCSAGGSGAHGQQAL